MPDGSLPNTQTLPDIDSYFRPTSNERARMGFVSAMRKHVLVEKQGEMKREYEDIAVPAYKAKTGHAPRNGDEAETAMDGRLVYSVYGALRYNAQEMVWASVQEPVERTLPDMISLAQKAAAENPTGGSLRLDPTLEVPRYVSALDVHLIPGCFHSEYTKDDVAQGAVVSFGGMVFSGALGWRQGLKGKYGAVGESVAHYIHSKYPDFKPKRILDMGTASGKNLMPYADTFPGAEIYGIDVAAPLLRFGHAKAEAAGLPIHFSQQNAETADFPDGYFDLIVSSFFFHEVPVKSTKVILKECHRLLAKGGIMAHMELPPRKSCTPYVNFFWDWDTLNNNEPAYSAFRASDPTVLSTEAGFKAGTCFELVIPNRATFGDDNFAKFVKGEMPPPPHGGGGWFIFGSVK
ncbi:MAG: class I SAM-dependent methyltransferase [Rhodospirillaceae bacterium]|nr:class I SAM-dependent methyltransferase [Rhodospirillaceae bacterium]